MAASLAIRPLKGDRARRRPALAAAVAGVAIWLLGVPPVQAADDYVGSAACGECHAEQFQAWQGSHHDLAMDEATDASVRGDFDDAEFTAHGVTSRFYRKDGGFWVRTDGPDGALADYEIAYTFGWEPLQQYLIRFPDGRLQALGIAWDTRPAEQGGQRWLHLYPDEVDMGPDHPLHWTGREQTWNYQCAECHSTGLDKGYDPEQDSYHTTWAGIDVGCEACHGPGATHVRQAERVQAGESDAWGLHKGLAVDLAEDGARWTLDPDTGLPRRDQPRQSRAQLAVCARCHSRRGRIAEDYAYGHPLSDTHRLSLLEPGLYYADGQILDEVYVYGSFLQSRMYHQGVTCSDCHDIHSLKLKQPGNAVCGQCHPPARYDTPEHHHHPVDAAGGTTCVDCHMPQRLYMVVDARADHSMRIPRPDLTLTLGTPNACGQCHTDQDARWALAAVEDWYGGSGKAAADRPRRLARALQAAAGDAADADALLSVLAADAEQPAIARATAIERLAEDPRPAHALLMPRLAADPDPLVRAAVARYLEHMQPDAALRIGLDLLDDPVRLVRIDAARALASFAPLEAQTPGRASVLRKAIDPALAEYRAAQLANAERPESWMNLGLLEVALRDAAAAEADYRQALALDPGFVPGYANLADLYRATGQDDQAREVLDAGLRQAPDDPALLHALGLLEIRAKRLEAALPLLARAAEEAPDNARYAYVQALAQQSAGDLDGALATLDAARTRHPADRDIGLALITLNAEAGRRDAAIGHAESYLRSHPDDAAARQLLERLREDPR